MVFNFLGVIMWELILLKTGQSYEAGRYNAALDKQTWQSSNARTDNWHSKAAVDGCKDTGISSGCCSLTKDTVNTWWSVDLGLHHHVHSLTILSRDFRPVRLSNLTIYGSDVSHIPVNATDKRQCAYVEGPLDRSEEKNVACVVDFHGRYIIIEKTYDVDYLRRLQLCEVEVEADCVNNTYGVNCSSRCSENCKHLQCDIVNGSCDSTGCVAGYTGDMCQTVCTSNTYGDNCAFGCSPNCKNLPCDRFTGKCDLTGCIAGYTGEHCDKACTSNTYGENCIHDCPQNCKNPQCDRFTGKCDYTGCNAGFSGEYCNTECSNNTYGENCAQICSVNCKTLHCDIVTGKCDGCKDGYVGDYCDKEIPSQQIDPDPNSSESNSTVIIVASVASVLLVALIVAVYFVFKYKRRSAPKDGKEMTNMPTYINQDAFDTNDATYANISDEHLGAGNKEVQDGKLYEIPTATVPEDKPYQALNK